MSQPTPPTGDQQPRGDFVAFMNRDKQPGDRRPAFEGRISKPGSSEKHPLVLWAHEYTDTRTGEVKTMFSGNIQMTAADVATADMDPADQISALTKAVRANRRDDTPAQELGTLSIEARQVVLFPNGFKDEEPDKDRPDYWGAFNPGDGSPVIRTSVWLKKDRNGRAYLSGATSYPLPGKSEGEMQQGELGLRDLVDRGDITRGMPAPRKGKGGRG